MDQTQPKTNDKAVNPVFDYIVQEAAAYKERGVPLTDNWEWSMFAHIKRSFSYKHSKFTEGSNGEGNERPFNNIILPVLNVAHRAEGFDVKNIVPYVDDDQNQDKSFFVKKFHDKWALKNGIDNFIDAMVESYVDYGLTIAKRVKGRKPEIVPLQRIEFCDQTDFMAGDKCELHNLSIDEINKMRGKWNTDAIDLAIQKAQEGKLVILANAQSAKTPGKYIEVHELHATKPETWLNGEGEDNYTDDTNYVPQLHMVGYYYDDKQNKVGIHFFKGPEKSEVYKTKKRDPIFGRACGWGGIEELFEPQQWTNYSEIQHKEMLDVASLMLMQVSEGSGKTKNILTDLEKGEVLEHENGNPYEPLQFSPGNIEAFTNAIDRWNQTAQALGSANEALLGEAPAAGTPFSLQALVVQQGFGLHDYRKGQLAVFMEELYREWFLEDMVREMKQGHTWLDTLSLDEMQSLADNIVKNLTWQKQKELLLTGQMMSPQQLAQYQDQVRQGFMNGNSKKFIEIAEGEIDGIPVDVTMDVANTEFDLQNRAQSLTNIFRQIVTAPQILQMPGMAKLFNEIIESSGFSPVDFGALTTAAPGQPAPAMPPQPGAAAPQPPQPTPPSPQPQLAPASP